MRRKDFIENRDAVELMQPVMGLWEKLDHVISSIREDGREVTHIYISVDVWTDFVKLNGYNPLNENPLSVLRSNGTVSGRIFGASLIRRNDINTFDMRLGISDRLDPNTGHVITYENFFRGIHEAES